MGSRASSMCTAAFGGTRDNWSLGLWYSGMLFGSFGVLVYWTFWKFFFVLYCGHGCGIWIRKLRSFEGCFFLFWKFWKGKIVVWFFSFWERNWYFFLGCKTGHSLRWAGILCKTRARFNSHGDRDLFRIYFVWNGFHLEWMHFFFCSEELYIRMDFEVFLIGFLDFCKVHYVYILGTFWGSMIYKVLRWWPPGMRAIKIKECLGFYETMRKTYRSQGN